MNNNNNQEYGPEWRKGGPQDDYHQSTSSHTVQNKTQSIDFQGAKRPIPSFYNSKRKDSHDVVEVQQPDNQRRRDGKTEVKITQDDEKEESLTREKQTHNGQLPQYKIKDGEFESFPEISIRTVEKLKARGITNLFPIQMHSFYPVFQNEDIIARDLTGSGKTLAFGLPLTEFFRKQKLLGTRKIQAIVLAPTRELALQVSNEFAKLKHSDQEFKVMTVYGGVNIDDQVRELRGGVEFFVGTTGRVLDHIERGNIDFSNIKTVILDEADQMLKLGFKEDVEKIMSIIKKQSQGQVQFCLFSATIPHWVKSVAQEYMKKNYRIIDLAKDLKNKTAQTVNHLAINCPYQNRLSALADILVCYGTGGKTIVFTETKNDANQLILSDKIKNDIEVMHGDIAQNQREVTMKRFKEGKFNVLVATNVCSRGLDIPDVDLIIQVEPPKEVETYIHRSGRTARAGKHGTCITFYTKKTYNLIQQIEYQAGIKFKTIGIPQGEDVIRASSKGIIKKLEDVNASVLPLFAETAKLLMEKCGNDPEKALCTALAYISGHYQEAIAQRSLLSGQERQITIQMKFNGKSTSPTQQAQGIIKKYWPSKIAETYRGMKSFKDMSGVVFDIYEDQYDRFMDNFNHLKETDSRVDFIVSKCTQLPELAEEDGESAFGSWNRGGDGGNGGNTGGYYNNGREMSFGGNNGYRGYQNNGNDRGYQNNGNDRGGYNNNDKYNNDRGGGYQKTQQTNWNNNKGYDNNYGGNNNDWKGSDEQVDKIQGKYGVSEPSSKASSVCYSTPQSNNSTPNHIPNSNGDTQLFINNLHFSVTESQLTDLFRTNKLQVVKIRILLNGQGQSKGAGVVEFATANDATQAMNQLNGTSLNQRNINLDYVKQSTTTRPTTTTGYYQKFNNVS